MDRATVFEIAINAIEEQAGSYQQNEIDGDPDIQAWVQARYDAIDEINKFKAKLKKMGML